MQVHGSRAIFVPLVFVSLKKVRKSNRRDRYLQSVSGLRFFTRDHKRRDDVVAKLDWALEALQKEDRVLWVLGIVRRYHLLTWNPDESDALPRKDKNKRAFALRNFGIARANEDYNRLVESFLPNWSHFKSLAEIHDSHVLRSLPFHHMKDGKQTPFSVNEVMLSLRSQEEALAESSLSKYCDDGIDFLELKNGWKWVRVAEGYSRQEAVAMGHCGNGAGKADDVLYSLREPIRKKNKQLWRPHLTFICNKNRFFGEMKGRANSKPSSIYNDFVTQLFMQNEFRGVKGGGYLPENNFALSDLSSRQIAEIVVANPQFNLSDFLCQQAKLIHDFKDGWDLSFHHPPDEPDRPLANYKIEDSVPMLFFRRTVKVGSKSVVLPALTFPFVQGYLGEPITKRSHEVIPKIVDKFKTMLRSVDVRGVSGGSIFRPNCPWFELLGVTSPDELVRKFPHFASATSLNELACRFGEGPHLVPALSLQIGKQIIQEEKKSWRILRFRSLSQFLENVMDCPTLRAFRSLKEEHLLPQARQNLKNELVSRVNNFRFGQPDLKVGLEYPESLGSACYVTVTNQGLAKICADIHFSDVTDSKSFLHFLVRTYDYNRATLSRNRTDPHSLNLAA